MHMIVSMLTCYFFVFFLVIFCGFCGANSEQMRLSKNQTFSNWEKENVLQKSKSPEWFLVYYRLELNHVKNLIQSERML